MTSVATDYPYVVNGVALSSDYEKLTAGEILEQAAAHGAISDKPENYILQSLDVGDRKYEWNDPVDLSEDNQFIALQSGPTPVA